MWCPSLEDKEGDTHSLFAQILINFVWWFRWCPVYKPTLVITKWEETKSFGITRSHGAEVHFGFLENCQISMVSLTGFNSVILRVIRSPKNWNCLGYLDDPHFVGKYQQVTFADWGQQFNDTMDMEIGWCSCEPEFAEVDVQMCSKKCNTKLLVQRIFSCENIPKGLYTIMI